MSTKEAVLAVCLMALVTYVPRAFPVVVVRKEIKTTYIKSFLHYVPFAVLGSLTFPEVFYSTGDLWTAIAGTVVALLLAFYRRSLVLVAAGAILTVFLTGLVV